MNLEEQKIMALIQGSKEKSNLPDLSKLADPYSMNKGMVQDPRPPQLNQMQQSENDNSALLHGLKYLHVLRNMSTQPPRSENVLS